MTSYLSPSFFPENLCRKSSNKEMKICIKKILHSNWNGKFPANGKIPRDQKPRVFLVMGKTNCLTLKNPCFIKECILEKNI